MENVQEKIEEKEEETVEVNEQAEYTTLIATEEELTSTEAGEHSVFSYGTGIFLGLLAATGIGLFVKKSQTQSQKEDGAYLFIWDWGASPLSRSKTPHHKASLLSTNSLPRISFEQYFD